MILPPLIHVIVASQTDRWPRRREEQWLMDHHSQVIAGIAQNRISYLSRTSFKNNLRAPWRKVLCLLNTSRSKYPVDSHGNVTCERDFYSNTRVEADVHTCPNVQSKRNERLPIKSHALTKLQKIARRMEKNRIRRTDISDSVRQNLRRYNRI